MFKELAEQMDVNEHDVIMLATSVINDLTADKMATKFINASDKEQRVILEAYVIAAVEKYKRFLDTYLTNPEARDAFIDAILRS